MTEKYFEHLQTEYFADLFGSNPGTQTYNQASGELYQDITQDTNITEPDAVQIARMLNNGEVGEAEVTLQELLTD